MRILVTFAFDAEFAPWQKLRPFKKVKVNPDHYSGGIDSFEAHIGSNTVWVFLTGMGIKFFDFKAASCFRGAGVNIVLSSGLAGSLNSEHRQNELVVPRRVGNLRDATGVPLEPSIVRLAESRGARMISTLLTADRIIGTAEEKKRLGQFGEAVDMESFHVASRFIEDDVMVGVIRAISDDSGEDLPIDFSRCLTPQGRPRIGALSKELLSTPSKLPALIKFGLHSRKAAQTVVAFLDGLIEKLTPEVLAAQATEVAAQ